MLRLYSYLFWTFLVVSSALLFPVAALIWAVTTPFDRRKRILHLFTCLWGSIYSWANPAWPVTLHGRHKIDSNRACVLVANHLSMLDILILFRIFKHYKWVSKIENFKIPFIGWNMSLNGYIKLKRGDRESVIQMLGECEKVLAEGSSVLMFPEGTRSPTGQMRSFKPGAFEVALRAKVPIQPILIRGTANALPKHGLILRERHAISLTVLDRIEPETFEGCSVDELTERVHDLMASELGEGGKEPIAPVHPTGA